MPTITPTRPRTLRRGLIAGFAALALATTALTAVNLPLHAESRTQAVQAALRAGASLNYAELAERVGPAVVSVQVIAGRQGVPAGLDEQDLPPALRRFFEQMPRAERPAPREGQPRRMGQGSGFIIDADGTIVTNNHVVGGAEQVRVKLSDGREFEARVLGSDARTDLAVLKIEARAPLPFVTFAATDAIRVGEPVMAMGNPFGLGGTVTAGIISARARDIGAGPADDFLQHDAAINPGNSGGPLFNLAGEVVGVNTAILSPSGGNIGIGFAIPAPLATRVVAELREHGKVERGFIGVNLAPLEPTLAAALGREDGKGAVISQVVADSPAARAGLRVGDVITAIDGRAVETPRDVVRAVSTQARGAAVTLSVLRRDGARDITVTLATAPAERAAAPAEQGPRKAEPRRG